MIGLKKNCALLTNNEKKNLIEKNNLELTILKQAELLGISRSSVYYQPKENPEDKIQMDLIDQIYTNYPFFGSRRIKQELRSYHNTSISRGRVKRLMQKMGLVAIYPKSKRNLSQPNVQHKKYPYLLNNLSFNRPNQVWAADITYLKVESGWLYLIAVIDWFSRYVLSWQLSNALGIDFCLRVLEESFAKAIPEIFNTDQGTQFTSFEFTDILNHHGVKISMDGRGRYLDNIFTERLWRTVKYENVYLKSYSNHLEAKLGLTEYFDFYNNHRLHQSLNYLTPAQVHFKH